MLDKNVKLKIKNMDGHSVKLWIYLLIKMVHLPQQNYNCFSIVYNDDKYLLGFSNVGIFGHIVLIHI